MSEEQLLNFRQEVDGKGISSYPHPKLMPEFWQFPTVSMGLGPLMAIYQARFLKYLEGRGLAKTRTGDAARRLETTRAMVDHPDWSVLLDLLSSTRNGQVMLERVTNGRIGAGWHRVVADPSHTGDRLSVVQFLHPTPWTVLAPLATCVDGSRPQDCSRARKAPENPVPVKIALSTVLSVKSRAPETLM